MKVTRRIYCKTHQTSETEELRNTWFISAGYRKKARVREVLEIVPEATKRN